MLTVVVCSVLLVPARLSGRAVLAHVIGCSNVGSALVLVSGILVGWLNQRWKPVGYLGTAIAVVGVLGLGFIR